MGGALTMPRLTWDEIEKQYPDQWVAIKDAEMDGADIISGEVVAAMPDREMRKFRISHFDSGYVFTRTSDGDFDGYIDSDIRIAVDQSE